MAGASGSLAAVWALQRLDSELDTLRRKAAEIPRKIEGLNLTVSDEKRQLEDTRNSIVEMKKRYKLLEVDVKEAEEKASAKSAQLYSAATNEMYKAFLKELEGLGVQKGKLEDQMIEVMEQLEKAERRVQALTREAATIEQETQQRVGTLQQELAELQAAMTVRENERQKLLADLDRNVANVYERIRKNKNGVGAVSLNGDRCNGCLSPLPPQLLLEVSKKDRLHFCEHCGRILVPPDIT
jgi:predicted  nucleic acid-binding Zn-ribbon protein